MAQIDISDEQKEAIQNGETLYLESDEFSEPLEVSLDDSDELTVEVVSNVEPDDSDTDSEEEPDEKSNVTRKSAEQLKSELVEIKTQKKKLESELSDIMERIDYFNDKIRLAKKEDREDLVEKAEKAKAEKMEEVEELNEKITELKEREHKVREQMDK